MYLIRINWNNDLYYPGDEYCTVSSAKFNEQIGAAGSFEFTLPQINPYYDGLNQRVTEIQIYQDDALLFNGEIRELSEDFWRNKKVYCVGELSYFNDSIQPLQKLEGTRAQLFQQLVSSHNSQVEEKKRFEAGFVEVNPSAHIKRVTNYVSTLEALNKLSSDSYLRIRRVNGTRYIDLVSLESYGRRSEQHIEFSENLIDYALSTNSESIASAVIPFGQSLDESPVEDETAYVDIKSVNDGIDYVFNPAAVEKYGWIKRVVHFNVLSDPAALKTAGINWLADAQYAKYTYKLTAFDLSTVDANVDDYSVGDYIRCISPPHGMDAWLPVREREIDLLNLANNTITVGAEGYKSFTQSMNDQISFVLDEIANQPSKSEILKAALKNATELINANGDNGYIVLRQNNDGKLYEILVMNAPSIEQSTQAWRWNLSGFGYGTKPAGEPDFTWRATVAITMSGDIVANAITTGTMSADRMQGGTLHLGGGYGDGVLRIHNSSGTEIGRWSKAGIYINGGSITIGSNFSVDSEGNLTARSGTFSGSLSGATGTFSGNLSAAGGTFSGNLSAAGGTFSGSLSAASGTFKGELVAGDSKGGKLVIDGGDMHMTNNTTNGPGIFFHKSRSSGTANYSAIGCTKIASRKDGSYLETDIYNVVNAGKDKESDRRLKKDIKDIPADLSKNLITGTKTHEFKYKDVPDVTRYGMVAQEVVQLLDGLGVDSKSSGMVYKNGKYYSLNYKEYIPHLINYVKDLQAQIDTLKGEVNDYYKAGITEHT